MSTIRQRGQPYVYAWPDGDITAQIDLSSEVVSLSTSKRMGSPSGSWSITLLPRALEGQPSATAVDRRAILYRTLRPNTVVSIGFQRPGGILMGLVDEVRKTSVRNGRQVSYGLVVKGRDMGKALEMDNIVQASLVVPSLAAFDMKITAALGATSPLLMVLPGVWGPASRDGAPTFLGSSVQDAVDWILSNASSMQIPLLATIGTQKLGDWIDTSRTISTWNDGRVWSDSLSSYSGSVWGFLQSVIDPDFYEAYLDFVPSLMSPLPDVVLVVRPKPFDEPKMEWAPVTEDAGITWGSLLTLVDEVAGHEVFDFELLSENLGYSDGDAFSYYAVTARNELIGNPGAEAEGLAYPLVDTWAVKRFGLRSYNASLSLAAADIVKKAAGEQVDSEVAAEVQEFRNRIFNWYRMASMFETGSITVPNRDAFRIGDPIIRPEAIPPVGDTRGMRYYCVGVDRSWQYGSACTATLTLTRGHNDEMIQAFLADVLLDAPPANPLHYAAT